MNRRRTIFFLCILLPLFFMGCQTYTAAKGKATIEPLASVAEAKTITKYSVLQEEQEALLKEKALQEQQEQAALVVQQQAERDMELASLTEREKELSSSLTALNSRLEKAAEEKQQLIDSLTELTLENEKILLDTQLSSKEDAQRIEQLNQQSTDRIKELQQKNAQLANEILELQSLIDENKTLLQEKEAESMRREQEREDLLAEQEGQKDATWQELKGQLDALASETRMLKAQVEEKTLTIDDLQQKNAQLANEILELQGLIEENKTLQQEKEAESLRLEQERKDLLAEQEGKKNAAWQELNDQLEALASETRMLKAQLEEKTLTIEEKVRLEQLRSDEAKRLEQERLAKRLEQEAEEKRLTSQEEAKLMALEKEWRQIPTLDQITYPRLYKTEKPITLAKEGEKLRALMLPLDDVPWKDSKTVIEVHNSIIDLEVPIIFVTGHMENVVALVREMRCNAAIFSTGAIITSFPIQDLSTYGVDIQYQEKKVLRLVVANLPEYQVLEQFARKGSWQATQKNLTGTRLTQLKGMLGDDSLTVATLLGASLYEPSYRDWNTFSPVAYRQIDYLWPLSAYLENEGFYDTYRLSHFSEATNAGNTLVTPAWSERVDFIYSRKILPLESAMLIIGGESAPDERGFSRFGILGTFLVP